MSSAKNDADRNHVLLELPYGKGENKELIPPYDPEGRRMMGSAASTPCGSAVAGSFLTHVASLVL